MRRHRTGDPAVFDIASRVMEELTTLPFDFSPSLTRDHHHRVWLEIHTRCRFASAVSSWWLVAVMCWYLKLILIAATNTDTYKWGVTLLY